jgi:hypothetical protein
MERLCYDTVAQCQYSFGSKIIYGSDWFMPIDSGVDRKKFLAQYQEVFRRPKLQNFYRGFFFENALAFLNAEERLKDSKFRIDPETKKQLGELLARRKLPPK